jgi:glycosyltransferase involved in cell wall biosynthesis
METLRFLMVSTHFPPYKMGGDANLVGYLAEELVRRGHEVHVAYNPSVYRILRGALPQGRNDAVPKDVTIHEFVPFAARPNLLLALTFGMDSRAKNWLESIANRSRFDVVHWHNTKGFVARPLAIGGSQSLYTAHDYYSVCPRSNLIRPGDKMCMNPEFCQFCLARWKKPPQLWRIGGRRVLRLPEGFKILCPSEYIANRLRTDGIDTHCVLRNFVPDPGESSSGIAARDDTIVFVGILERRKGPQTLLQAFIESKDDQHFKLVIAGEGPLKNALREKVRSSGVQDRISVPGFLSDADLEAVLRQASLMVVPSEWPDNAPLTTLEAFSFGVPVAGTKKGGLPEILTPESGSMLFEACNVRELSELLVSLWGDRQALRLRGRMARRTYEERFSPEVHLAEYMHIIGEPGQESTDLPLIPR